MAPQLGLAIHASACDPWHFGFAECGRQAGRQRRWWASVNLDPASVAQRLWQQTRLEHPTIGTSLHRLLLFQHSPEQLLPLPSMPLSFRTKQAAMGVDVVAGGTRKWHLGAIGPRGLCPVLRSPCRQRSRQLWMLALCRYRKTQFDPRPTRGAGRHVRSKGRIHELRARTAARAVASACLTNSHLTN
jgi:hypothetical protein